MARWRSTLVTAAVLAAYSIFLLDFTYLEPLPWRSGQIGVVLLLVAALGAGMLSGWRWQTLLLLATCGVEMVIGLAGRTSIGLVCLKPAQATIATAHKISRLIYSCLRTRRPYSREHLEQAIRRAELARFKRLQLNAQRMGCILVPDLAKMRERARASHNEAASRSTP